MFGQYPGTPYQQQQYGGFQNPYQARLEALQRPQPTGYQITRVTGRNGAEAFQMPPNSSIMLLDETAPIVWLAQTDGAGYKTCTPYQITPYQAQPAPDYDSLDQRLTRLEAMIGGKPDAPATDAAGTGTDAGTK